MPEAILRNENSVMKLYFAPIEGIGGYVYRNAHQKFFGGADKYFSPFLAPTQDYSFTTREKKDVLPENNRLLYLVPQILTNKAEQFLWAAEQMEQRGYREVNLNLGCPSGTVVSKGKGSGFLGRLEELQAFLDDIFSKVKIQVSVKTRLGVETSEEFEPLLELFHQYPISELIIHPRVQKQHYRKTPDKEAFRRALEKGKIPVGYNGDLFTTEAYQQAVEEFPGASSMMLGRGVLGNPGLLREIRTGQRMTKEELQAFLDEIYENYRAVLPGSKPVYFKMKELWFYMGPIFTNSERYLKKIRKAKNLEEYKMATDALFREQELIPGAGFPGTP